MPLEKMQKRTINVAGKNVTIPEDDFAKIQELVLDRRLLEPATILRRHVDVNINMASEALQNPRNFEQPAPSADPAPARRGKGGLFERLFGARRR